MEEKKASFSSHLNMQRCVVFLSLTKKAAIFVCFACSSRAARMCQLPLICSFLYKQWGLLQMVHLHFCTYNSLFTTTFTSFCSVPPFITACQVTVGSGIVHSFQIHCKLCLLPHFPRRSKSFGLNSLSVCSLLSVVSCKALSPPTLLHILS